MDVWRERLTSAKGFLHEAEDLVEEAKRDLIETLYALGANTPLGARVEVVNDLYWNYPELKASDIALAFGYEPGKITHGNVIRPFYSADLACPTCGVPHEATSRNKLAELRRDARKEPHWHGGHPSECESCRNIRFAERDEQWEAERQARADRLHALRTMPYQEYLQSPEWQAKRQKKLRSAGFRCELCNMANTVLDVHHRTYERRGDEYHRDLIVLCRDCHAKFHDKIETVQ